MKAHPLVAVAFALVALAACARGTTPAPSASSAPVVSNDFQGSSTLSPQPPNSLPAGATVNAPLTSPTGVLVGIGTRRR